MAGLSLDGSCTVPAHLNLSAQGDTSDLPPDLSTIATPLSTFKQTLL